MKLRSLAGHIALVLVLLLCGCYATKPLRGGRAIITPKAGGLEQTLLPPDNPAQPSRQDQETIRVRTYTVPAGSRLETITSPTNTAASPAAMAVARPALQSWISIQPALPMPVTEREETRAHTELGAAQKDTARELGARLASLKSLTWVGLVLFVLGVASLFWPPLKAIVGSVTTSLALLLGGLALMILPTLVVGRELLLLGGVGLSVGAWFIAHRHGQLRGQLESTLAGSAAPVPGQSPAPDVAPRSSASGTAKL